MTRSHAYTRWQAYARPDTVSPVVHEPRMPDNFLHRSRLESFALPPRPSSDLPLPFDTSKAFTIEDRHGERVIAFRMTQTRKKYGRTISAIPSTTRRIALETKYGKTMRASPQTSGTIALCFLPYTKKPSPIEPNSTPHSSKDVLNAASSGAPAASCWMPSAIIGIPHDQSRAILDPSQDSSPLRKEYHLTLPWGICPAISTSCGDGSPYTVTV